MRNDFLKEIKINNNLNEIKSKLSLGIINSSDINEEYQKKLIKKYKESINTKKQELKKIKEEILNIKRS